MTSSEREAGKPTSGEWIDSGLGVDLPDGRSILDVVIEQDAMLRAFIAEAGTVYHETGQSPREIAKERDELVGQAEKILKAYDMAMACQGEHSHDAKLMVLANYGDLALGLLRALLTRIAARSEGEANGET